MFKYILLLSVVCVWSKELSLSCGHHGGRCCPPDGNHGTSHCQRSGLTCSNRICSPCGAEDQPICSDSSNAACDAGLTASDGWCVSVCGSLHKSCCPGELCASPELECSDDDQCVLCGLLGHPPCTDIMDAPCHRGLKNAGRLCVAQCTPGQDGSEGSCAAVESPQLALQGRKDGIASRNESRARRREF